MFFEACQPLIERPIGILGGTFDPIHTAHLRLAEEAMHSLQLGSVVWIPAGNPYHRQKPGASAQHRLAMVRAATAGDTRYRVDDAEAYSNTPSYTVPTLERLRLEAGDRPSLVLLTGADAFLGITSWHRWRELFSLAHVAIASRPGFPLDVNRMPADLADEYRRRHRGQFAALATAPAGVIVDFPLSAGTVSSTEVRTRLRAGQAVDQLLPAPVLDYIHQHRLYTD